MYTNVTDAFTEKLSEPSRHFRATIYENGTPLDLDVISIRFVTGTCGGSSLAVGCAFAAMAEFKIRYTDLELEGKELFVELGLLLDDGTYEDIPFGHWTVQKPSRQNDIVTFQAVDRIAAKLNEDYSSSLTYPASIANVISELQTNIGITIHCDTPANVNLQVPIENISQRGALSIIAATLLGNAWCDRNGEIHISTFNNPSSRIKIDFDYVKEQPSMDETASLIEGVKVYTVADRTDTWITSGSGHMIEVSDVYMTQDILNAVASNIKGLSYGGGSVMFMGNPLIDPSDVIYFKGNSDMADFFLITHLGEEIVTGAAENIAVRDYLSYDVPCMEITQFFDGGLTTTITAAGSFEKTEKTFYTGPITEAIERNAKAASEASDSAYAALQAANQAAEDLASQVLRIDGDIGNLQDQIDGNITTWFYAVDPTTENEPASDWDTDDEKNNHLGDLYYNTESGYCWRWMLLNNVYSWQRITDSDVTRALADAAKAQDTADEKRRVFYNEPVPPYDQGDLWAQGSSGDILRCQTARSSGSYTASDWVLASRYTDDTAALAAQSTASNAMSLAGSKNKIFYQSSAPTTGLTAGDLWFKTSEGNAIYEYTSNGTWTLRQLGQGSLAANSVTAVEINVSTLSAISAYLGSAIIGGANNQNGTLTIKDASNNTIGYWNNTGINAQAGKFGPWNIGSSGIYNGKISLMYSADGTYIGTDGIAGSNSGGHFRLTPDGNFTLEDTTSDETQTSVVLYVDKMVTGEYAHVSPGNVIVGYRDAGYYLGQLSAEYYSNVYSGKLSVYATNGNNLYYNARVGALALTRTSDGALITNHYGSSDYNLIRNHNNGNISISASSAGLYLGYENTTFVNFLNGKMSLNSQGNLTVNGHITAALSDTTDRYVAAQNNNGSVCILASTNRGLYDLTSGNTGWIIYTNGTNTWLPRGDVYISNNCSALRLYLNSKLAMQAGDTWLRINDTGANTSGVYFGSSFVRTDGDARIGAGVADALFTDLNKGAVAVRYGTYNALQIVADAAGTARIWRRTANNTSFNLISCANNSSAITAAGDWTFSGSTLITDYSGTTRRPVCSITGDGGRVAFLQMTSATQCRMYSQNGTAGSEFAYRTWTVSPSDIRLKEHIEDTKVTALDALNAIRLRSFDWKSDHDHWKIGMIADEVEKIDPKFAVGGGEEDGVMNIKSIDTFYMMGYVIKAIQELTAENKSLKKKITSLERKCA